MSISFSAYEDRLVLRAERGEHGVVSVLLTRRMVMIILQQLLTGLPTLTGLSKTPAQYWQEVLQMSHQHAMQVKSDADKAKAQTPNVASQPQIQPQAQATSAHQAIYLATELTVQTGEKQLILAFKGLPMPQAMVTPSPHEAIFATPLQIDHVHQLLQLLITKSQEAQWHLPLELPWMESPVPQPESLSISSTH